MHGRTLNGTRYKFFFALSAKPLLCCVEKHSAKNTQAVTAVPIDNACINMLRKCHVFRYSAVHVVMQM